MWHTLRLNALYQVSSVALKTPGWIYCLSNASHSIVDEHGVPGFIYKVGLTTLDPFERARQLTAATASPTPFHVVHYAWAGDANDAEGLCHAMLDEFRVNNQREFFRAPLSTILGVIERVTGTARADTGRDYPMAALFATFDQDGPDELSPAEQAQCRKLEAQMVRDGTQHAHRL